MPYRTSYSCVVLVLAAALAGCGGSTAPTDDSMGHVSVEAVELDWTTLLGEFLAELPSDWHQVSAEHVAEAKSLVVDLREPGEYAKGFIDAAVNIPLRELVSSLEALPSKEAPIVLVADREQRSAIGLAVLRMLGYEGVRALDGGLEAWQAAGLAVVTSPVPGRPTGDAADVDARLRAELDYYLTYTLPVHEGALSPAALTEDQKRLSSAEVEAQPETFDQGRSLLVDVDAPEAFAEADLEKSINLPLRGLTHGLDDIALEETVQWA